MISVKTRNRKMSSDGIMKPGSRLKDVPKLRLLLHKLLHQLLALLVIQHHHFFTPIQKIFFAAHEALVLPDDNPLNLVEYAGTCAHVAWRQCGVHSRTLVGGGGKTARILESRHLGLR
jgi:hypothetical protein